MLESVWVVSSVVAPLSLPAPHAKESDENIAKLPKARPNAIASVSTILFIDTASRCLITKVYLKMLLITKLFLMNAEKGLNFDSTPIL